MTAQHRRKFLKFLIRVAYVGGSFLTATCSFLRLFNPGKASAKKPQTGILLKDVNIDKYGRVVMKDQKDGNMNTADDDYVQDKWRPPQDPSNSTLKQCGSRAPDQQCKSPSPPDSICNCPDLICPCPKPPEPPWPVPDLVCPCPKPPKPPS
jgi:hypothetical protein